MTNRRRAGLAAAALYGLLVAASAAHVAIDADNAEQAPLATLQLALITAPTSMLLLRIGQFTGLWPIAAYAACVAAGALQAWAMYWLIARPLK